MECQMWLRALEVEVNRHERPSSVCNPVSQFIGHPAAKKKRTHSPQSNWPMQCRKQCTHIPQHLIRPHHSDSGVHWHHRPNDGRDGTNNEWKSMAAISLPFRLAVGENSRLVFEFAWCYILQWAGMCNYPAMWIVAATAATAATAAEAAATAAASGEVTKQRRNLRRKNQSVFIDSDGGAPGAQQIAEQQTRFRMGRMRRMASVSGHAVSWPIRGFLSYQQIDFFWFLFIAILLHSQPNFPFGESTGALIVGLVVVSYIQYTENIPNRYLGTLPPRFIRKYSAMKSNRPIGNPMCMNCDIQEVVTMFVDFIWFCCCGNGVPLRLLGPLGRSVGWCMVQKSMENNLKLWENYAVFEYSISSVM